MKIIRNMMKKEKFPLKSPKGTFKKKFIIVHNTANDASPRNEIQFMNTNNWEVSFHYAIGYSEIVQGLEDNRHTNNCANDYGNKYGIAVEICYSKSGGWKFNRAEILASKFIAYKLKEYGWGIDQVKKHQDFNGKYCPHRTLDLGWNRFLKMIENELDDLKGKEILYRVQVGAFKDKKNAEKLAKELKANGYEVYIPNPRDEGAHEIKDILKVGDYVKVKKGAKSYDGVNLATFVYKNSYRIDQLDGSRAVLDSKGINTPVDVKNLKKL